MRLLTCDCGGTPKSTNSDDDISWYYVHCPQCGSSTPEYDVEKEAQLMWNLRCCKSVYWDS